MAVLAVDPSSTRTGGSILGDKTRMERLAVNPDAFVRPSPTAGTLGGVAKATRETMLVMEAAGYDVVLVETVGVGQSEATVAQMVDSFLLLSLARTGDQLQGIKKGVLEIADVLAVNKADGPHERDARSAARELAGALRLMRASDAAWTAPVLTCSGREGTGLAEVWERLERHTRGAGVDRGAGRQAPRPAGRVGVVDGPGRSAQPSRTAPGSAAAGTAAGGAGPRGRADGDAGGAAHRGGVRPAARGLTTSRLPPPAALPRAPGSAGRPAAS